MKYWILAMSLLILGCGGESGGSAGAGDAAEEEPATVGEEVADALNDAQQAARDVEATLGEKKKELDEELDKVEGSNDD